VDNGVILLVEDNPDDVVFTLRALKSNNIGNKVVVAADGEEALAQLFPDDDDTLPLKPSLILLDVKLPKVGGLEVLQRIRADPSTCTLPVVVLTTSNEERDIVASYQLGANSYVRKPVVFGEFVEAARVLGLYWLLVNEPPPPPPAGRGGD
jgi:two-component system response regulator